MSEKQIDELSGVETTGHSWDGISELNNPLPRWWLWTFYATIVWALGYTILYPSWPGLTGNVEGLLGWSSRGELASELTEAQAAKSVYLEKIAVTPVADILGDAELSRFATAGGAAAFKINCTPCHGSGAAGGSGYPNLNDDEWVWGGSIDEIYTTITHGIRSTDDESTHLSEMPAFADILSTEEVRQVSAFVYSLSGGTPSDAAMVEPGETVFADNCASCHGEDARGLKDFGAPNLTDAIWLRAEGTEAGIAAQVARPTHGVMPAWGVRLGDTTVKELAVFVHSLGGGQ
ncbi:cytochrome-c oxidase, cbb3-type subunit III [Rhizobiaceae bacterium BDR2-2]|uniref:Cbb3-type cytochrome c oxidase subunit n=1 Tax=Ectorhizobium quercum TaxID=2965071 RepID=A0AAE3SXH7_9HYPH|nr:cytochrome-c oxidase, cbb3-type subunit III [Ectorhizobium quercum]MCX8999788.1 cytochrome-c oxidase, cbb3-type subunit III [Ectorhizobium quercum]